MRSNVTKTMRSLNLTQSRWDQADPNNGAQHGWQANGLGPPHIIGNVTEYRRTI